MRGENKIPHAALIYSDIKNRNRLIDSYLDSVEAKFDAVAVFSANPGLDSNHFSKATAHRWLSRQRSPTIFDANAVVESSSDVPTAVAEAYRVSCSGVRGSRVLFIGDWIHLVYSRFEVALDAEERLIGQSSAPICCYFAEGFWSLDPSDIAKVFLMHRRVLVDSSIITMNERQPAARG